MLSLFFIRTLCNINCSVSIQDLPVLARLWLVSQACLCKDLPDTLMAPKAAEKHSEPCQTPAKDISSIPSFFHFFQYLNQERFDSLEQSITSKVCRASQREAGPLKRLVGGRGRTSTKCRWQLAQVHQDEPQAGQMHSSGVRWNHSSDRTRHNRTQSRWGKVIRAAAGQENEGRSRDTALMQIFRKSPHCLGAQHGTNRPRAFAAARYREHTQHLPHPKRGTGTRGLDSRLSLRSHQERLATRLFSGLWYEWSNRCILFYCSHDITT